MEKLSLFEKFKNLFRATEQTEETSKDLVNTMRTDVDKPLTEKEQKELKASESKLTEWEKMDSLNSMIYIASFRDKVKLGGTMDIPESFALDRIYDGVKSFNNDFKRVSDVARKIVRMNSDEMKIHIKEFIQLLSTDQKNKVVNSCKNFIDTIDSPKKLSWKVDNYIPNQEEKEIAVNFAKDFVLPLFIDSENNEEKYK
jgi:hypothetical protein